MERHTYVHELEESILSTNSVHFLSKSNDNSWRNINAHHKNPYGFQEQNAKKSKQSWKWGIN